MNEQAYSDTFLRRAVAIALIDASEETTQQFTDKAIVATILNIATSSQRARMATYGVPECRTIFAARAATRVAIGDALFTARGRFLAMGDCGAAIDNACCDAVLAVNGGVTLTLIDATMNKLQRTLSDREE